ncbi:hypothetical protein E2C01_093680 [Portunus trituberculatus]|uniref:Uncharacterized protein n=1 Tax=Portunus trituberculatus TaxID=210409 RepID=A0A5B7JUU0_PORTR|nr:hypothetical protein [Portunus trituberculatus]
MQPRICHKSERLYNTAFPYRLLRRCACQDQPNDDLDPDRLLSRVGSFVIRSDTLSTWRVGDRRAHHNDCCWLRLREPWKTCWCVRLLVLEGQGKSKG